MPTLNQLIDKLTKPVIKKRGFSEVKLLTDWPQIVGAQQANQSIPLKITRYQDNATLEIQVNPGHALELQMNEPIILEKIATYFGFHAITRLKFIQSPVAPSQSVSTSKKFQPANKEIKDKIQNLTKETPDDNLQSALQALGEQVHLDNPKAPK